MLQRKSIAQFSKKIGLVAMATLSLTLAILLITSRGEVDGRFGALAPELADIETSVADTLEDIEIEEFLHLEESERYLQKPHTNATTTSGRAYSYEVHEYLGEDGLGYVIYLRAIVGQDEYLKIIDKGVEKRSADWRKVPKLGNN